jgi:8-oxo-dGTP pyrophosphatase MutT (NUDIX family)
MSGVHRKKRINVGCVTYTNDVNFIGMLKEKWGHEVLQFDDVLDDFLPSKAAPCNQGTILTEMRTPILATVGDAVLEVTDALCDACQILCESVADNVCSSLDAFSESIFLSECSHKLIGSKVPTLEEELAALDNKDPGTLLAEQSTEESVKKDILCNGRCELCNTKQLQCDDELVEGNSVKNAPTEDWNLLEDAEASTELVARSATLKHAYVLLITSRSDPSFYILPKGGLHAKESPCCGALRECWEESGVSGHCEGEIPLNAATFQRCRDYIKKKEVLEEEETRLNANVFQESGPALPDRDSKGRKIKEWHWFSVPAAHVSCEWPECNERKRIWVPVNHLSKLKRLRTDARYIVDAWLAQSVQYELVL